MAIDDKIDNEYSVERDCRRHNYETVQGQTTCCSVAEKPCIYKAVAASPNGHYRCLNLDKQNLWQYRK